MRRLYVQVVAILAWQAGVPAYAQPCVPRAGFPANWCLSQKVVPPPFTQRKTTPPFPDATPQPAPFPQQGPQYSQPTPFPQQGPQYTQPAPFPQRGPQYSQPAPFPQPPPQYSGPPPLFRQSGPPPSGQGYQQPVRIVCLTDYGRCTFLHHEDVESGTPCHCQSSSGPISGEVE